MHTIEELQQLPHHALVSFLQTHLTGQAENTAVHDPGPSRARISVLL